MMKCYVVKVADTSALQECNCLLIMFRSDVEFHHSQIHTAVILSNIHN